jgi:hypothetical protein
MIDHELSRRQAFEKYCRVSPVLYCSSNGILQGECFLEELNVFMMMTIEDPVSLYLTYAQIDAHWFEQLETHLRVLQQNGLISLWSKRQIMAGMDWKDEVNQQLEWASLVLLLVIPDFLASDYGNQSEMKQALARQEAGLAQVIPILVRPCDWKSTALGHLQPLPRDGKPISTWRHRDEAWLHVVEGIKQVLEEIQKKERTRDERQPEKQQPSQTKGKRDPFPPVWNVPYRYAPFFTGREGVLVDLFANFTAVPAPGIIPVQALTGLGGLGKTQTAVAYAFRYRKEYQTVLWIKAETKSDLLASFTTMAKLLALPGINVKERESVLEGVEKWLSKASDWLLILDNADNLRMVELFLPMRLVSGHLLLTTRATAMEGLAQPLALMPLTPEEGALCLLRRASYIGWNANLSSSSLSRAARKAALDLSLLMGGLPLALEQAGAYIETTGRGVTGYLKLYEQYREEIQGNQYGDILYYRSAVAFAWNLAREAVKLENPAALELLYLCAYLAPDAIPYELFPKDKSILGPTLGPVAASPLALDQALTLLRRHSLIKNEVDRETDVSRIFIHRVLQEILRDSMDPDTQQLWAERAVRVTALALPLVEWSIMQAHVQSCLPLMQQWNMTFREADTVRQHALAEHI